MNNDNPNFVDRPQAIHDLNCREGLPPQGPNEPVWNNAIFQAPLLDQQLSPCHCIHLHTL